MLTLLRVLALLVCGLTLAPPGYCLCHGFEETAHDDHAPGCPAVEGGKKLQRGEPTADAGAAPVFVAFVGGVILPVAPDSPEPIRPAIRWAHAPPLYLSHCALVL